LVLPDDGEVLFGLNMEIGKKGDWQCEDGGMKTTKIYEKPPSDFYNPESWLIYDNEHGSQLLNRPRLDAMRVPGDQVNTLIL
jgi:hypothetical protein